MTNLFKVAGKLAELAKLGSSPKDALSNLGAIAATLGVLLEGIIQLGWLGENYAPIVRLLPEIGVALGFIFVGVPTGRDQSINPPQKLERELNG